MLEGFSNLSDSRVLMLRVLRSLLDWYFEKSFRRARYEKALIHFLPCSVCLDTATLIHRGIYDFLNHSKTF